MKSSKPMIKKDISDDDCESDLDSCDENEMSDEELEDDSEECVESIDDNDDEECDESLKNNMDEDESEESDSDSMLPEDVNFIKSQGDLKILMKNKEKNLKLKNQLEKEKRSLKAFEAKKEKNMEEECLNEIHDDILGFIHHTSDEELEEHESIMERFDIDNCSLNDNSEISERDDEINESECNSQSECELDSKSSSDEKSDLNLPEKTILIKKAKQLRDIERHEKACKAKVLSKFELIAMKSRNGRKPPKKMTIRQYREMKKLKRVH